MRKGDLVTAISAHRAGTPATKAPARAAEKAADGPRARQPLAAAPAAEATGPGRTPSTRPWPQPPGSQ